MRSDRAASAWMVCLSLLSPACSKARGQVVVFLDTDAIVPGQLDGGADLPTDATVDTLRIDIIADTDRVVDSNEFSVADPGAWPVSFGVPPGSSPGAPVLVRARLFQRAFATPGQLNGQATLDPAPQVTIDRLVSVTPGDDDVVRVRVLLAADCLGALVSFDPPATCVDAMHLDADPTSGVEALTGAAPPTEVGTWPAAKAVPCKTTAGPDRICIPGGFSILGDLSSSGAGDLGDLDASPPRPVVVQPFLMDRAELTVGRFRKLALQSSLPSDAMPTAQEPSDPYLAFCTWLGPTDATNDDLPLNCISWSAARHACQMQNGDLPTEAQWEHAARGRGRHFSYPWGESIPKCCTTSASRAGPPGTETQCAGSGPEPSGSHRGPGCDGGGDVSLDGVWDLGGSLAEATLDSALSFSDPCESPPGILHDPQCTSPLTSDHVSRGGEWNGALSRTQSALRQVYTEGAITEGFRCVYPDR